MNKYIFISFLFPKIVFASLWLNVSIVYKKGIDKGLVLINELHSKEELINNNTIQLRMKNGINIDIKTTIEPMKEVYGPSMLLKVQGMAKDLKGNEISSFEKSGIKINSKTPSTINFSSKSDQVFELTLKPVIE